MHYIKGTANHGLFFTPFNFDLTSFSYAYCYGSRCGKKKKFRACLEQDSQLLHKTETKDENPLLLIYQNLYLHQEHGFRFEISEVIAYSNF